VKLDGFLVAVAGAIALALAFPAIGAPTGPLHVAILTNVGIGLIFFLHGAALTPAVLRAGAANWRLHALIHGCTFVLFPTIGFLLFHAGKNVFQPDICLGLFFLCALPSTISSSVAMTALARGNVSSAIFDATISGLIGMVVTPLLVGLVVVSNSAHLPFESAVLDVFGKLLLPFAVGQLLRPYIGSWVQRHKPWIGSADRGVIVLIIYGAFCESTADGLWSRFSTTTLAEIALIVVLLLGTVLTATTLASRALGFDRPDEVAAVFCGSKKSLANGAPIAMVLFSHSSALGMIMLPLLLYHQAQLIVCSVLAKRYAQQAITGEVISPIAV
jgi:sodium/bile acid cotransporter 7